jgi:hypothetical protein
MTTKTNAIRALNDELRQNLSAGTAVITAGVAALGAEAVARIVKTIAVYDDFCHANDRMKSTISVRSKSMATRYFSRSTTTINRATITRQMRPIPRSPSG